MLLPINSSFRNLKVEVKFEENEGLHDINVSFKIDKNILSFNIIQKNVIRTLNQRVSSVSVTDVYNEEDEIKNTTVKRINSVNNKTVRTIETRCFMYLDEVLIDTVNAYLNHKDDSDIKYISVKLIKELLKHYNIGGDIKRNINEYVSNYMFIENYIKYIMKQYNGVELFSTFDDLEYVDKKLVNWLDKYYVDSNYEVKENQFLYSFNIEGYRYIALFYTNHVEKLVCKVMHVDTRNKIRQFALSFDAGNMYKMKDKLNQTLHESVVKQLVDTLTVLKYGKDALTYKYTEEKEAVSAGYLLGKLGDNRPGVN